MGVDARRVLELISSWPTVPLGAWPTPIERHAHPSLGELLVKRDDLARFGRRGVSGVKARKLETFIGYLVHEKYDELVMPLANMTNLGHDIVPPLNRWGVRCRLLIVNDPPMPAAIREVLFEDVRDHAELLGRSRAFAIGRLAAAVATARVSGGRPIGVLPSPGHPSAVIGSARGFVEMVEQLRSRGDALPRTVFVSAAAGATVAGFALASALLRSRGVADVRVIGVQVTSDPLRSWTRLLLRWTMKMLGMSGLPACDVEILRLPEYAHFVRFDDSLEDLCERVHDRFGLQIDPIYGGKSWSAMEQHASALCGHNGPTMFWHCGYTPDWRTFRRPYEETEALSAC